MTDPHSHNLHEGVLRWVGCIALAIALSLGICCWILAVEAGGLGSIAPADLAQKRFLFLAALCCLGSYLAIFHRSSTISLLFRFRWPLALGLWALCVVFEISGSSLSLLSLNTGGDGDTVFGIPRPIRTDEWAVFTPMALSQVFSDGGDFSYFQDTLRAVETDMYCVYGQPVADWPIIFRPFQLGYLFLGAAKGLSFFWCGRLIMLFMVSLELGLRFLCPRSRALALGYAALVALSPFVQWWFSVNGLVEMILFGSLALLWGIGYLRSRRFGARLLYALGISWCLAVFVLTMYPAWEVPFAYIFLALLIALLLQEVPKAHLDWRDGLVALAAVMLAAGAVAAIVFFKSAETVAAVSQTAYPGQRESGGGGYLLSYFWYPFTILAPLQNTTILPNPCEAASIYSLFPFCLVLPFLALGTAKGSRKRLIPLLAATALLLLYAAFGMPSFLADATLLGKSTASRVFSASTFAMAILLFMALHDLAGHPARPLVIAAIPCWILLAAGALFCGQDEVGAAKTAVVLAIALALMLLTAFAVDTRGRRLFCVGCLAIAFMGGALVNPVARSIDGLLANPAYQTLQQCNGPEEKWASVGDAFYLNNLGIASGARTVNSVNTYPQLDTWRKLDPEGAYEDIYNRYAHILVNLTDGSDGLPLFQLEAPDSFTLNATADDLRSLGITRLYSPDGSLGRFSTADTRITPLASGGTLYFYRLEASA